MSKTKLKTLAYTLMTMALMPNYAHAANDKGVAKVLQNLMDLFQVGAKTIVSGSFVAGLGCAAYAFYLFKSAGEPNGQNKGVWFQIALFAITAGGLMYLGAASLLFGDSLLGADGTAESIDKKKYGI